MSKSPNFEGIQTKNEFRDEILKYEGKKLVFQIRAIRTYENLRVPRTCFCKTGSFERPFLL